MSSYQFTSESVSEGHPDKICDQVSDAIVDLLISREPEARVAAEVLATTNKLVLAGEIRAENPPSREELCETARQVVKDIGYEQEGFHWDRLNIDCFIHEQSPDIAGGVDEKADKPEGAGDQGIMFGYACDETNTYMPAAIQYSHNLLRKLSEWRHQGETRLGPDAKSQVTLLYENGRPGKITSIVLSSQHGEQVTAGEVEELVKKAAREVLPEDKLGSNVVWHINPTGRFVIGGPDGDAGLTGRKIIVDTYGGAAPHGGGAFSGKDPTKVDRSAAYAARYLAKNIVAAGLAKKCLIQLSYAIGVAEPVSILVHSYGTGKVDDQKIADHIIRSIDLTPRGIRTRLSLNRPIYQPTASYGHFGRTPKENGAFSWERLELVENLKRDLG